MSEQRIVGYHQDEEQHWVAELECGHTQHVRHTPPWQVRPWVVTPEGRESRIGTRLPCRQCADEMLGADANHLSLAERVRQALVQTALEAYEDATVQGLCADGAWEAAVSALRQADLSGVLARILSDGRKGSS